MIRVVDLASEDAAPALRDALAGTGFAVVEGHGVDPDALAGIEAAARTFFSLPDTTKHVASPRRWNPAAANRYRGYFPSSVEGKEGLDLGDPRLGASDSTLLARPGYETNCLPDALEPEFHACVERYFEAQARLGARLMADLVRSIGGDPEPVLAALSRPEAQSTLRFNGYPENTRRREARGDTPALVCDEHFDSVLLTILHQDRQGGLQVRATDGRWLDVPFIPGAFVLNVGQALERLSGGHFPATAHRVVETPAARLSIPFFVEPRWDLPIGPATIGLADDAAGAQSYETFLAAALASLGEYTDR